PPTHIFPPSPHDALPIFDWPTPDGETGLSGPHHGDSLPHGLAFAVPSSPPLGVPGGSERNRHRRGLRAGHLGEPSVADLRLLGAAARGEGRRVAPPGGGWDRRGRRLLDLRRGTSAKPPRARRDAGPSSEGVRRRLHRWAAVGDPPRPDRPRHTIG